MVGIRSNTAAAHMFYGADMTNAARECVFSLPGGFWNLT